DMLSDLISERNDAVHGSRDENQVSILDGLFGCVGNGVAPSLFTQCEANFRSARPEHDAAGGLSSARGEGSGSAEQAGSEDGEGGKWHDDARNRKPPGDQLSSGDREVAAGLRACW